MASKSKKRRRVLGASCILAALIIAGSSFAWFTSKDEVTNRLTASSDYGVSIVESFAPPKNFLPGQEVNKDVYATNTGSIAAFVEETVSSKLSIVKDVDTATTWGTTIVGTETVNSGVIETNKIGAETIAIEDCVELTKDEYYSIEAGAYLAYKPYASQAELGNIIVSYPNAVDGYYLVEDYIYTEGYTPSSEDRIPATDEDRNNVVYGRSAFITKERYNALPDADKARCKAAGEKVYRYKNGDLAHIISEETWQNSAEKDKFVEAFVEFDFTPDAEGLYVFRRSIDVESMTNGGEFFTYGAYYYKDGKYYKVNNLVVSPDDMLDFTYDGVETDGQLVNATGNLVYEKNEVVTPVLSYDQAENRLVATYSGTPVDWNAYTTAAANLDEAEHNLAQARARLQKAMQDQQVSEEAVAKYLGIVNQREAEMTELREQVYKLNEILGSNTDTKTGIYKQVADEEANRVAALHNAWNAYEELYGANYNGAAKDMKTFNITYGSANLGKRYWDPAETDKAEYFDDNTLYKDLLTAKEDLEALKTATGYGDDMFTAYVNEIKAKLGITENMTFDQLVASDSVTWSQLDSVSFDGDSADELHLINTKTIALKKAQKAYDEKRAYADSERQKAVNAVNHLGTYPGSNPQSEDSYDAGTDMLVDSKGTEYSYETRTAKDSAAGLYGDVTRLVNEIKTLNNKKVKLEELIKAEMGYAIDAETAPAESTTAAENLETSINEYNTAYRAYKEALDVFTNAETAYNNSGDLKIYINLSDDVVVSGGIADKWQILPVDTVDTDDPADGKDTAFFYYTSILQPGETSAKLIDSVVLDKDTTQNMYKYFDFDIDVQLKSAQVTYDNNGSVLATAVTEGALDESNVTIKDPSHEKTTALTWG